MCAYLPKMFLCIWLVPISFLSTEDKSFYLGGIDVFVFTKDGSWSLVCTDVLLSTKDGLFGYTLIYQRWVLEFGLRSIYQRWVLVVGLY